MDRTERAEFTCMCMVTDGCGNILVQDRQKADWPGVAFPGGHVEPGESFVRAVVREVHEETGLQIENPTLCGIKQFQTSDGARYVVLFYQTSQFSGQLAASDESAVFWIPREDLSRYKLSVDFLDMVKVFESDSLSEFYYQQDDGDWSIELL